MGEIRGRGKASEGTARKLSNEKERSRFGIGTKQANLSAESVE